MIRDAVIYMAVLVGTLIVVDVVARYFFPRLSHAAPWVGMEGIAIFAMAVVGALFWFIFN